MVISLEKKNELNNSPVKYKSISKVWWKIKQYFRCHSDEFMWLISGTTNYIANFYLESNPTVERFPTFTQVLLIRLRLNNSIDKFFVRRRTICDRWTLYWPMRYVMLFLCAMPTSRRWGSNKFSSQQIWCEKLFFSAPHSCAFTREIPARAKGID